MCTWQGSRPSLRPFHPLQSGKLPRPETFGKASLPASPGNPDSVNIPPYSICYSVLAPIRLNSAVTRLSHPTVYLLHAPPPQKAPAGHHLASPAAKAIAASSPPSASCSSSSSSASSDQTASKTHSPPQYPSPPPSPAASAAKDRSNRDSPARTASWN